MKGNRNVHVYSVTRQISMFIIVICVAPSFAFIFVNWISLLWIVF